MESLNEIHFRLVLREFGNNIVCFKDLEIRWSLKHGVSILDHRKSGNIDVNCDGL